MAFQKFVAWEDLQPFTSKTDAIESSSSSRSGSASEYEAESHNESKDTATKLEIEAIPSVEIPPNVKIVLDKIETAQLERAKKDISKKLFHILENVNRAYEHYRKAEGNDPETEKEFHQTQTWEEKSRRSHFLNEIDDVLDDSMIKVQELRLVLEALKGWNGMLKVIEMQDKIPPAEHIIDEMEKKLLNSIDLIEAKVHHLIQLYKPLFTEKAKPRRKSAQRTAFLFKAWRDKVAEMPQESEVLTPDQMLEDEPLTFSRFNDVNNMIQELGESPLFNRAETAALKYIASMVTNIIKAFSLLAKQCRGLKFRSENVVGVEGRKDPQLVALQRELRMALEKKSLLEIQVKNAEERCKVLLIANETIQKELREAKEKVSLADKVSFSSVTSSKYSSKPPSNIENDIKSKQDEKPKLHTVPKKKQREQHTEEILEEKSQGDDRETPQVISENEESPKGSTHDIGTKQTQSRRIDQRKSGKLEDKLPDKVIAQITTDEWEAKLQKASDGNVPLEDKTFIGTSKELEEKVQILPGKLKAAQDVKSEFKLGEKKKMLVSTLKVSQSPGAITSPRSSEERAVVHFADTIPSSKAPSKAVEVVASKPGEAEPIKSRSPAPERSPLTEQSVEDDSGQKIQKDKKETKRRVSVKVTADKIVQNLKLKKMVKLMSSEATQRPASAPGKQGDKDVLETEQTKEEEKELPDKSKEIQEEKESEQMSKMIPAVSLPKQAETSEGIIHSESGGVIDIETIKDVLEESYKDTTPGPMAERKTSLPPDTAEKVSTKERKGISRAEETAPRQDTNAALHELQKATLACLEDKIEKLKKGPLISLWKRSAQFQPTDPQVQQFFKVIEKKVEECFLLKQKPLTTMKKPRLARSSSLQEDSIKERIKPASRAKDIPVLFEEPLGSPLTLPEQPIPPEDSLHSEPEQPIPPEDSSHSELEKSISIPPQDSLHSEPEQPIPPEDSSHSELEKPFSPQDSLHSEPEQPIPPENSSHSEPKQPIPPEDSSHSELEKPFSPQDSLYSEPEQPIPPQDSSHSEPKQPIPPEDSSHSELEKPFSPQDSLHSEPEQPIPPENSSHSEPKQPIPPEDSSHSELEKPFSPQDSLYSEPEQPIPPQDSLYSEPEQSIPPEDSLHSELEKPFSPQDSLYSEPEQPIPPQDSLHSEPEQSIPPEGSLHSEPKQPIPPEDSSHSELKKSISPQDSLYSEPEQPIPPQDSLHSEPEQPIPPEDSWHSEPEQPIPPEDSSHSEPKQPIPPKDSSHSELEKTIPPEDSLHSELEKPIPPQDFLHSEPEQPIPPEDSLHSEPEQPIPPEDSLHSEPEQPIPPEDFSHSELEQLIRPEDSLHSKSKERQEKEEIGESQYQKQEFSQQDELLPKMQEKEEEDLAKASPPMEEEQSMVSDEGNQQIKELRQKEGKQRKKTLSGEHPKTIHKEKGPSRKESKLKLDSIQQLNAEKELWYLQLEEQLQAEKERLEGEKVRLQGECQRIEETEKNLGHWQELFQVQQKQWEREQEQHKEQEHLWQVQLEHWQLLQQESEKQQQYWTEEREKQKEQQRILQEELQQLQQQYQEYMKLQGKQAEEQWLWKQVEEEHRRKQQLWQEEDAEQERKRQQWQQQLEKQEEQMGNLRHMQQEQERRIIEWQEQQQEKQQELERLWEKHWRQQLQSWERQMQQRQYQELGCQEQENKVQEKQKQIQTGMKPLGSKLRTVEGSDLVQFVKQHKISSMPKEKFPAPISPVTPTPTEELKEDSPEMETSWFPKLFTKTVDSPTENITEKRYWINVEAQRKNLELLRVAAQNGGISSTLYSETKETIKQALHSTAERLALLFQKYKLFYQLQKVRQSIIVRLNVAKETKDGAKIQTVYKMVDKVDAYQKKILNHWKVKQDTVEKQHQHCLEKMIVLFTQLHLNNKLHLSCPYPLMAGDGTKEDTFPMPSPGSVSLKSKVYKSPLISVKKPQDFTLSAMIRDPSSRQIESLWKTDVTELSFPLGPKPPVTFLWPEACSFPDIPRFLELDISSVRKKPLQHIKTRIQNIPRWKMSGNNFMHL